jgi:hypothetical protein
MKATANVGDMASAQLGANGQLAQQGQQDMASATAGPRVQRPRTTDAALEGAGPAKPDSFVIQPDGSVLLIKPRLELQGELHYDRGDIRTMQRIWNPERALIIGSLVIIEEWSLAIPLAYVHVLRFNYVAPVPKAQT